jgi:nucleotide-binding universal stress UspA family protein
MKTILVLTDFTIRADHAAHYALKLAQKIKANLLLCNVYPAAPVRPVTTHTAWTSISHESFEEDSISDLSELAGRLNKQLSKISKDEFRPAIEQCSKTGSLTGAINEIATSPSSIIRGNCHAQC